MRFNSLSNDRPGRRRVLLATLAVVALPWGCAPNDTPSPNSLDITGANYGNDFRLTDAQGRERTLADFQGKVVLMFFGFTQCPDVCPTALAVAVEALQILGADASKVQVLFVSLDPERDTREILKAYVSSFDPSFIGLSADLAQTQQTAEQFKVFFRKVPLGGSYTLDHTAITYVFDPVGQLRLAFRAGQSAMNLAEDIRLLLAVTR